MMENLHFRHVVPQVRGMNSQTRGIFQYTKRSGCRFQGVSSGSHHAKSRLCDYFFGDHFFIASFDIVSGLPIESLVVAAGLPIVSFFMGSDIAPPFSMVSFFMVSVFFMPSSF